MYGRTYNAVISGTASPAAAFDLFEINAAAAKPFRLLRLRLGQTSEPTTEEEQLALTIRTGYTSSGSGGSAAASPAPTNPSDSAAGATFESMNTTQASGGSPVICYEDVWNIRAGCDIAWAPEEAPECVGGGRLVIQSGAPADAVTIRGTATIMELG